MDRILGTGLCQETMVMERDWDRDPLVGDIRLEKGRGQDRGSTGIFQGQDQDQGNIPVDGIPGHLHTTDTTVDAPFHHIGGALLPHTANVGVLLTLVLVVPSTKRITSVAEQPTIGHLPPGEGMLLDLDLPLAADIHLLLPQRVDLSPDRHLPLLGSGLARALSLPSSTILIPLYLLLVHHLHLQTRARRQAPASNLSLLLLSHLSKPSWLLKMLRLKRRKRRQRRPNGEPSKDCLRRRVMRVTLSLVRART